MFGDVLSLKKGQQNFSANPEKSHTDNFFSEINVEFFQGHRKQMRDGKIHDPKYKRKEESKRNSAWKCQDMADDTRKEKGAGWKLPSNCTKGDPFVWL